MVALVMHGAAAQESETATTREKVDRLIESWRGQPEDVLKDVWGR